MVTLYRQYRPQTFAELVGQDHVTKTLQQAITKDKLTHAYMFYGPRGTGKTTTARLLAKRVNCLKPQEAEPCGRCSSCQALQEARHPDVLEIDAASNRGIDDIRVLRERTAIVPALGSYKVYIIDEVHMLTPEAAAALLKTLEEPVKHVIFILATTELHKVLPTIISRCQVYRFRRATDDELRQRLTFIVKQEKRPVDEEALTFIVERSDGCYRDAESLLGQMLTLHDKQVTKEGLVEFLGLPPPELLDVFLAAMVRGEAAGAVAAVDEAFAAGHDPEQFLKEVIRMARDGCLSLVGQQRSDEQQPTFVNEENAAGRLPDIIRVLLQALQDLAYVPQPLIALHLAVLTVCTKKGTVPAPAVSTKPDVEIKKAARPQLEPVSKSADQVVQPKNRGQVGLSHLAKGEAAASIRPSRIGNTVREEAQPLTKPLAKQVRADTKAPASPGLVAASAEVLKDREQELTVEQVKAVWPKLIDEVKNSNPVAATFLRAVEPQMVDNTDVTFTAHYSLHRNFFDKPEHKKLVASCLGKILDREVRVNCLLDEQGLQRQPSIAEKRRQHQDKFQQSVQEVFG